MAVTMLAGCGQTTDTASESTADTADNATEIVTAKISPEEEEKISSMTSLEMIRAMGNGINLGNTLEAYNHKGYISGGNPDGFETGWGQP